MLMGHSYAKTPNDDVPPPMPTLTDRFTACLIFAQTGDLAGRPYFPNWAVWPGKVNFKPLVGCYKGAMELSYLIADRDTSAVIAAGILRGQEAVIYLAPQERELSGLRNVYQYAITEAGDIDWHKRTDLGQWHSVTEEQTRGAPGWTMDPATMQFYIGAFNPPKG